MLSLRLRWSEHEARKQYARPFMVTFLASDGDALGSIAMAGADLLYWRQFGTAVAALSGELLVVDAIEAAGDPQRAWLDILASLLPAAPRLRVQPRSTFDHDRGRLFGFVVTGEGVEAVVDAPTLLEYQDFQAALAHQSGRLLRVDGVEAIDDPVPRRRAWLDWLRITVERPAADEAMADRWPLR